MQDKDKQGLRVAVAPQSESAAAAEAASASANESKFSAGGGGGHKGRGRVAPGAAATTEVPRISLSMSLSSTMVPDDEYVGARMKMDELFIHWLSSNEARQVLEQNLEALSCGDDVVLEKPQSTSLLSILQQTSSSAASPRLSTGGGASPSGPTAVAAAAAAAAAAPPRSPNTQGKSAHGWGAGGGGGGAGSSGSNSCSPSSRSGRFDRFHSSSDKEKERLLPDGLGLSSSASSLRDASHDSSVSKGGANHDENSVGGGDGGGSGGGGGGGGGSGSGSGSKKKAVATIPAFYSEGEGGRGRGKPPLADQLELRQGEIDQLFAGHPEGMIVEDFVPVTKTLCGFPSFFNAVLFRRILVQSGRGADVEQEDSRITKKEFEGFWRREIEPFDAMDRFFRLVKQESADVIEVEDFEPFIRELIQYHPGLEFLESHPDFHSKYASTVTTRIFYEINTMRNGKISAREVRRSNIVEAFSLVDEEEDINKVTEYFSYEHFYVLFCRFYELDSDRDSRLSREDLLKYGEHGMSRAIVDRIMEIGHRPWGPRSEEDRDFMTYDDYVYFMLSEEDRGSERSLRYWFDCCDLDGDKKIRHMEMRYFYNLQIHRMESLGHEVVPYEDVICQMWDMIKLPADRQWVELRDFLQEDVIKVAGVFFDALFNLNKFIAFEQRDPFAERQKRNDPFETEWDRFAFHDYNRLAAEDERDVGEGMELDVNDDWIVTSDDEEEHFAGGGGAAGRGRGAVSEAPF